MIDLILIVSDVHVRRGDEVEALRYDLGSNVWADLDDVELPYNFNGNLQLRGSRGAFYISPSTGGVLGVM